MQRLKYILGVLLVFGLGWYSNTFFHTKTIKIEDKTEQTTVTESRVENPNEEKSHDARNIPQYVLETLEYIQEYGEAPKGYVGGRNFQNREGILPKTNSKGERISYREWDVHPKEEGKNRGAERLVTSSDGIAYYTEDHYRSFKKIQ